MIKARSFTRPVRSGQRPSSRFAERNTNIKRSNFKPRFGGGFKGHPKKRFGGERIDYSRFIKKQFR